MTCHSSRCIQYLQAPAAAGSDGSDNEGISHTLRRDVLYANDAGSVPSLPLPPVMTTRLLGSSRSLARARSAVKDERAIMRLICAYPQGSNEDSEEERDGKRSSQYRASLGSDHEAFSPSSVVSARRGIHLQADDDTRYANRVLLLRRHAEPRRMMMSPSNQLACSLHDASSLAITAWQKPADHYCPADAPHNSC